MEKNPASNNRFFGDNPPVYTPIIQSTNPHSKRRSYTLPGKWRQAAAHGGQIFALPVEADSVLQIDPQNHKAVELKHFPTGESAAGSSWDVLGTTKWENPANQLTW